MKLHCVLELFWLALRWVFAVHDPKAEEIPSHLHSEIEMSQLSKQVQWSPLWLHQFCIQKSVQYTGMQLYQPLLARIAFRFDILLIGLKRILYLTHSNTYAKVILSLPMLCLYNWIFYHHCTLCIHVVMTVVWTATTIKTSDELWQQAIIVPTSLPVLI